VEEGHEVAQPHEEAGLGDLTLLQTQIDAVEERIRDEGEEEEHAGRQHDPAERTFTLEETTRRRSPADFRGGTGHRRRPYRHGYFAL
jgi:hypothetical protein